MQRGEKIKQFLGQLKDSRCAKGSQGDAFFVEDENGKKYILKKYVNADAFKGKKDFLVSMRGLREASLEAIEDGVKVPRIYDYDILPGEDGPCYAVLERKMPGNPIYMVREDNVPGERTKELWAHYNKACGEKDSYKICSAYNELRFNLIAYNLRRQDQLLSAPQSTFDRLMEDLFALEVKNQKIDVDPFPENLLFNNKTQRFSFIDLAYEPNRDIPLDHVNTLWKLVSFTSLFEHKICKDEFLYEKERLLKNEFLIQKKVIDTIENHGLLYTESVRRKNNMLTGLSYTCTKEILSELDNRVAVRSVR